MRRGAQCARLLGAALATAAAISALPGRSRAEVPAASTPVDRIAEAYVKLVLAVGVHDADYVDAYYGPAEWRAEAEARKRSLEDIRVEAGRQILALACLPAAAGDELAALRHQYLLRQLQSLVARAEMLSGMKRSFDEESQALYDAVAPRHEEEDFEKALAELDAALPGKGALIERYAAFRDRFVIPKDRLDAVFRAAIDECRRRTKAHVDLPADERFDLEFVTDKPWGGYNWYKGGSKSLIQVNTDLPTGIGRAVDLACHEGYPGHHVYNALLEKTLVSDRGWVEYTVYPLFSPQSLIAEGTANYGIEVAFPGDERAAFERQRLFPLAGLDPAQADAYHRVQRLLENFDYAGNEVARGLIDGTMDGTAAAKWLETYTLATPDRANQQLRFVEKYRSYVINYNLGRDLVRAYIERRGGTADQPDRRWEEFKRLLASPRLPSGLR
jgi:hypothetical protein